MKDCKESLSGPICPICAESHSLDKCTNKNKKELIKFSNCTENNNHTAFSKTCPLMVSETAKFILDTQKQANSKQNERINKNKQQNPTHNQFNNGSSNNATKTYVNRLFPTSYKQSSNLPFMFQNTNTTLTTRQTNDTIEPANKALNTTIILLLKFINTPTILESTILIINQSLETIYNRINNE